MNWSWPATDTVKGYDPRTGRELWSLDGPTEEVIPNIVVGPKLLYSASGRNGPIIALRPGGDGDVTETHLVWRTVRVGPHVPSPALVNGRLYSANDTGVFTCLDAATRQTDLHGAGRRSILGVAGDGRRSDVVRRRIGERLTSCGRRTISSWSPRTSWTARSWRRRPRSTGR